MNENIEGDSERPVKLCPRCPSAGRLEPNERHIGPSGRQWGYCKPCTYEYQEDRRHAYNLLLKDPTHLTDEVREALEVLKQHTRGRKRGDNKCPRCNSNERAKGSAYCNPCGSRYRKDRREARIAAQVQAEQMLIAEEAKRRQEIDDAFERSFGFRPKPLEEEGP
jgi:hypothetical protein